ncbi:MAG TPA: tetratricopeptide repeat protein [Sedimentisphaerales bacterium]|nr:tetratricopeptide repeat protein [Sedimentisphaerales bacterium]
MKSKYMDNSIEHSLFAKTRSSVIKVGLIALIGTIITVSVYGCKDSKDYRDYYNRGVARIEKGEHDNAISDFTKTIEMRRGFAMAHFYRGRTYFRKGEHDQAISDLNEAIEIDPQLAVAYGERAVIYFIRKEYDKVWENIHKQESLGLEANPGFLKALREASGRKR